jgi:hypothetical protein
MEIKDYMFGFITENQKRFVPSTYVEEILEVKIKECDDDKGAMGEHYIVRLKQRVPDFTMTTGNQYKLIESTCLVNARQFNDFVEKHRAIIWL